MRILFWCDTIWPHIGGVEVLLEQFVRDLRRRGHQPAIVANRDTEAVAEEDWLGDIPILRLPFRQAMEGHDVFAITRLKQRVARFKEEFRPDVLHLFQAGPSLLFFMITRDAYPAPYLMTAHQFFQRLEPGSALRRALEEADWVTGCSDSVMAETVRELPSLAGRATGIPNGPEVPDFQPVPAPRAQKLLCVGRIVWDKGFDVALQAVRLLRERYPGMRLSIAGDGVYKPTLEANAVRLGVSDLTDFLGWVEPEKIPQLMSDHDIVVMPSEREPFGIVAVQAAMMERPIVATNAGGLPEIVVNGETGFLVPPSDPEATADKIATLIDDPDLGERMGKAARPRVIEAFDWDAFMAKYEALYQRLAQRPGAVTS